MNIGGGGDIDLSRREGGERVLERDLDRLDLLEDLSRLDLLVVLLRIGDLGDGDFELYLLRFESSLSIFLITIGLGLLDFCRSPASIASSLAFFAPFFAL